MSFLKEKFLVRNVLIFVLFSAVVLPLLREVLSNITHSIFNDLGDPLLSTWILAWDVHALTTKPLELFQSNSFYPYRNTLAYSEHFFGLGIIALPIIVITGNPLLANNLIFVFSFIASGFTMYLLVSHLTKDGLAGIFAGLLFVFCSYRFSQIPHIGALNTQWMPLVLLYLHKFFDERRIAHIIAAAFFFILQALSCGYYMMFIGVVVVIFAIYFLISEIKGEKFPGKLLAGFLLLAAISGVVLIPFHMPYFEVRRETDFVRDLDSVRNWSLDPKHYLVPSPRRSEKNVYPGSAAYFSTVYLLSILIPRGRRHTVGEHSRRVIWFYAILAGVFVVLSFGPKELIRIPHLKVGGIELNNWKFGALPYMLFYKYVPGFGSLGVVGRFGVITTLALAVLGGWGLALLRSRVDKKYLRGAFYICIIGLMILDYFVTPIGPIKAIPVDPLGHFPEVYNWLAEEDGDFAVAEFPFSGETLYLYYSTQHWKKLVNGDRGSYEPPIHRRLRSMEILGREAVSLMREIGVRYAIVHTEAIGGRWKEIQERIVDRGDIALVRAFGGDYVYEIVPPGGSK